MNSRPFAIRRIVEATVIGEYVPTGRLVLKYHGTQVADLSMEFLHDGRPPVVRDAVYNQTSVVPLSPADKVDWDYTDELKDILGSLNVASKHWVIRQYDHEVQGGSAIKPLVGIQNDGPGDALRGPPPHRQPPWPGDLLRHEPLLRRPRHLLDGRQCHRRGRP